MFKPSRNDITRHGLNSLVNNLDRQTKDHYSMLLRRKPTSVPTIICEFIRLCINKVLVYVSS